MNARVKVRMRVRVNVRCETASSRGTRFGRLGHAAAPLHFDLAQFGNAAMNTSDKHAISFSTQQRKDGVHFSAGWGNAAAPLHLNNYSKGHKHVF